MLSRSVSHLGRRFAAALLPRLFGTNPRSHHKGATGRVRTGDQLLPVLCHCQLGQDIPKNHTLSKSHLTGRLRWSHGWTALAIPGDHCSLAWSWQCGGTAFRFPAPKPPMRRPSCPAAGNVTPPVGLGSPAAARRAVPRG